MRPITGHDALVAAAFAIAATASPTAAPICPHCRKPVGATLDEQHRHATGRCAPPEPTEPNRARGFLDRQFEQRLLQERAKREEREAERQKTIAASQDAAEKRLANAHAKRERKAQSRKSNTPSPTEL